jgi:EpsI family protein
MGLVNRLPKKEMVWLRFDTLSNGITEHLSVASRPQGADSLAHQSRALVYLSVLAGLFLLLYGPTLAGLIQEWSTQEESSHGFLVLPICIILLRANRRHLQRLSIEPSREAGLLVMATAGLFLILGEVGSIFIFNQISMLVMLLGLVFTLLGARFVTVLSFPLSYLLFMLPSLTGVVLMWNWQFQLATARMGVFFLRLLGIPAQLDQNHIILPSIILTVASSCSGARYLISIVALALPLGYLVLRRPRYRIMLVVLALTIGVTANWIRVVLIGLWAHAGGTVVHGPFHILQALSVAWVAFAGLFVVAWALSRMELRGAGCLFEREERSQAATNGEHRSPRSLHYAWAQAGLVLIAVIAYLSLYHRGPVPLKRSFATFPSTIGQWVEGRGNLELPFLRAVGAEEELHRIYVGSRKQRLHLYVAYFEYQQQGKEAVSHLTAPLHQGAQTLILASSPTEAGEIRPLAVNEAENHDILFWYEINGRTLAKSLSAKASIIWDGLIWGKTNGALVMIALEPKQNVTPKSNSAELKNFAAEVLPILRNYLP